MPAFIFSWFILTLEKKVGEGKICTLGFRFIPKPVQQSFGLLS